MQGRSTLFPWMSRPPWIHSVTGGRLDAPSTSILFSASIELLKRGRVEYEFRMTVVPGLHTEEDIAAAGTSAAGRPEVDPAEFQS